jgi:alpha-glucosidase
MIKFRHTTAIVCAALLSCSYAIGAVAGAPVVSLRSPGGSVELSLALEARDGKQSVPVYRVSYRGKELIAGSRLGLDLAGSGPLDGGFDVLTIARNEADTVSGVLFGKCGSARDHYREAVVSLAENGSAGRRLDIVLRAYDDGIAFRYSIPEQKNLTGFGIKEEWTEFSFAGNPKAYYLPLDFGTPYEAYYRQDRLGKIKPGVQIGLPMLLEYPKGVYAAVTEAALTDYAGLYLAAAGRDGFRSRLAPSLADPAVKVRGTAPFLSPWRVVLMSTGPAGLLESNLIHNLNPPSKLADVSWIQPGKIIFGWWNGYYMPDSPPFKSGVNTPTLLRYIDFAAANGIPFVSLDGTNDEAWYGGPCGIYQGQDITKPNPNLDLPRVFAYAKEKGVKIRIWMHWQGLEKYMDQALPLYEQWGVSGIMVDFINGDSQERVRFVQKVVEEAARYHLTVNFHGIYKPTGVQRTYPNLLSFEGVLGTEYNKWDPKGSTPEHELLTLFVRMIAGPLDIHQGSFHPVVPEKYVPNNFPTTIGTLVRQLAAYVLYENALPMLADSPSAYEGKPALRFIREAPVAWDETRVLSSSVGRYLAIARRKGKDWYVGCTTDSAARTLKIPLDFLASGDYAAEAYYDGEDAGVRPESVDIREFLVTSSDTLRVGLARAGGFALRLTPAGTGSSLPRGPGR